VLVASLLGVACGASPVPFNTMGIFAGHLHDEFGWSYRDLYFGLMIYGVVGALLAPYFGSLSDRYGVRRIALASTFAFGLCFAALSLTPPSLTGYYLIWLSVGLVGIGSTPVTWSRAVNLWFFRNRGFALGLMLVGTSLGAFVLPPLTVFYISHFGWRTAYALIALLPLLISFPVALRWFREPRREERPPEFAADGGEGDGLPGFTLGEAMRGYRFWVLLLSIAIISTAYGGLHANMVPLLRLHGIAEVDAAKVAGFLGLCIFVGRVGAGWLLDRIWAPLVTLPLLSAPALACWLLSGQSLTIGTALLCAFLMGLASGAETDLVAYFTSRYFGMAQYGRIYGVLYMVFGIGSAVAPPLYGWVRDTYGNYDRALFVAAIAFVAGALVLLTLGRYPASLPRPRPVGS
jgi:MFS family permease